VSDVRLLPGDSRDVLKTLADDSFDSCVTDPPYALVSIVKRFANSPRSERTENVDNPYRSLARGFMGQRWDTGDAAHDPAFWAEVLRVLKPGAHLVAFGGTRTYHRMACAIEDAGFEVRDQLAWLFATGFPKSHDVSKGIDRVAGADREKVRYEPRPETSGTMSGHMDTRPWIEKSRERGYHEVDGPIPATEDGLRWQGWGTALKPAHEPILLCNKPATVAQHFAIILAEITTRIELWLSLRVNGADAYFNDTRAKWLEEVRSVLDDVKINSLESIGIVASVALAFIFKEPELPVQVRTRDCFVLSHVRLSGKEDKMRENQILLGEVVNISTRILDISTCVMLENTLESIGSLWGEVSDAIWNRVNMYTIEMAIKLTTVLRTLNLSISRIISDDTGNLSSNLQPIVLARKPLSERTVAANVLRHGTGAINVDGCRIETSGEVFHVPQSTPENRTGVVGMAMQARSTAARNQAFQRESIERTKSFGRWPANVVHDGSDEVLAAFPDTGEGSFPARRGLGGIGNDGHRGQSNLTAAKTDSGSAARFFKEAKFSDDGDRDSASGKRFYFSAKAGKDDRWGSKHPTVKPVELIRWLQRLVTPPGGRTLDPFAGSGTAGVAALAEGFDAVLIEREEEYQRDVEARLAYYRGEGRHWLTEKALREADDPSEVPLGLLGELLT
jgi:DNA modification methylase